MDILRAMSDAEYDKIKDSYEDVLEQLAEALTNWDEREQAARSAVDKKSIQKADGTTLWMDTSITSHRVQFG